MELQETEKYDFITVGEALHFFPVEASLHKIKSLMTSEGIFVTFGYVPQKVKSSNEKENELFMSFYDKVRPFFTFKNDDLHNHYSDR
jgi:hypothetical protein